MNKKQAVFADVREVFCLNCGFEALWELKESNICPGCHKGRLHTGIPAAELAALIAQREHDSTMLAQDGAVFMDCMRLLGMDVSGAATTDIPAAIERLKAKLQAVEGLAEQALRRMWVFHVDIDGIPDEYLQTFRDRYAEEAAALRGEGEAK